MKKLVINQKVISGGALVVVDVIFFGFTNPTKVPPWLLIVGFGLVVVSLYAGLQLLRRIGGVYMPWLQRQKRPVGYLAGVLSVILALQSMGQLSVRDVVVLSVLTLVLALYYDYSKSRAT